jgi:hypothetical protein
MYSIHTFVNLGSGKTDFLIEPHKCGFLEKMHKMDKLLLQRNEKTVE